MPIRPAGRRGFTLIEILVALAVVAIALGAIVAQVTTVLNHAARLQTRSLAHWVALNQVAELQIRRVWPEVGFEKGTALMAEREWTWLARISATEDADIRRLDLEVRRDPGLSDADATLIAYLERP